MRMGLQILREECRTVPCGRGHRDVSSEELRALSTFRNHSRDHAVELSILAGISIYCARVDGGQCRPAEACIERSAVRLKNRGTSRGCGISCWCLPDIIDWLKKSGRTVGRFPDCRRHADG